MAVQVRRGGSGHDAPHPGHQSCPHGRCAHGVSGEPQHVTQLHPQPAGNRARLSSRCADGAMSDTEVGTSARSIMDHTSFIRYQRCRSWFCRPASSSRYLPSSAASSRILLDWWISSRSPRLQDAALSALVSAAAIASARSDSMLFCLGASPGQTLYGGAPSATDRKSVV